MLEHEKSVFELELNKLKIFHAYVLEIILRVESLASYFCL